MIFDRLSPAALTVTTGCRYGQFLVLAEDAYMGRALIRYGEYSESEVDLWRSLLAAQPNAIVADVGANIGAHTVALASLVPQGRVVAFEPMRWLYQMALTNATLNACTNVDVVNAAVGSEKGSIKVPAVDFTVAGNFGGVPLRRYDHGYPVPLVRLDDVLPVCHFIKADVEGMESEVLKGAERLIAQCRPVLYVEANPEDGHPAQTSPSQLAMIAQLQGYGYHVWWHLAPHHNPANVRGADPDPDHEGVVSYNLLALPSEVPTDIGADPLPRVEAPTPSEEIANG
jgi:FkbM family methyltransferase